jgi:hypothetical protein
MLKMMYCPVNTDMAALEAGLKVRAAFKCPLVTDHHRWKLHPEAGLGASGS